MSSKFFTAEIAADALALIGMSLQEDIGTPDISTGVDCTTDAIVPQQTPAVAAFVSREQGIVCGVEVCQQVLKHFADRLSLDVSINDGNSVSPGQTIAVISGPAHDILTIERTCLNFLGRLSGISSLTGQFVELVAGTSAQVFDTRKTTPGWRRLEKYAVACGGGQNHRMGLYDAILIKDNHLAFRRSQIDKSQATIPQAVKLARDWIADHKLDLPDGERTIVQLEVDTLEQLKLGLQTECNIILVDNMSPEMLVQAVKLRDELNPRIQLEASGGVNLSTIRSIAETGVERISIGALTHSATNFDVGLDWQIELPA